MTNRRSLRQPRWPLLAVALAVVVVAVVLLRSDPELHTLYVSVDVPTNLRADDVMRVISADPFVVEGYGSRSPRSWVQDTRYVHATLRSDVESLQFDDYILAAFDEAQLPCDCGPDEVPPLQPVMFSFEIISRQEADALVLAGTNTSGMMLRLSVPEGTLELFRDGAVLYQIREGDGWTYRDHVDATTVDSIRDKIGIDGFEEHSKNVHSFRGVQLLDGGYWYVPFGSRPDAPAELEPLVSGLMDLAASVVAEGERVDLR